MPHRSTDENHFSVIDRRYTYSWLFRTFETTLKCVKIRVFFLEDKIRLKETLIRNNHKV